MTRATTTTLAVAADYADAMMAARRAKNWLFLILLLILLLQIGIFLLARFVPNIHLIADVRTSETAATQTTTELPVIQRFGKNGSAGENRLASPFLQYLIGATDFLGVTLTIVLAVVLLLILTIMLVGRLVGVAHVTGAFIWCVVLLVILFPWQTLLNSNAQWIRFTRDVQGNHAGDLSEVSSAAANAFIAAGAAERDDQFSTPDIRIPGVLYTWGELARDSSFSNAGSKELVILKWARFIGWPVVAILMLMSVQARSSRGLKFALGESEMRVEVTSPPA